MSPGKRIVIVSPAHPLRGGIANLAEALAATFQKEGHHVEIVSFSLQYPAQLFPGKTQYSSDPAPKNLIIRTWINSINPFNWIVSAYKIRAIKPDLVIIRYWLPFMGPCLGTLARLVRWGRSTPIVALTDNVIPHEKRMGDALFTRWFLSACQAFVAMTGSVMQDIRTFVQAHHQRVVPHPVYDIFGEAVEKAKARQILGLDATRPWILFFGFIRHYKGLDLLLEALADERLEKRGLCLWIAGECYEKRAEYDAIIARYGLQDRVHWDDRFIPSSEVAALFGAADLVVQPYRTATQSGVTQIAYHFGRPMLVTRVGGLPEMVENGVVGYVVEPTPAAIADALEDFYTEGREAAFSAAANRAKERFSWHALTQALLEVAQEASAPTQVR